jgi:DNA polymerase (family X)
MPTPGGLDLDWRWHQKALELGCTFSINPDAHSTAEIDLIKWGVAMARKGGVPSDRVLNALDLASFRAYLEARKVKGNRTKLRPRAAAPRNSGRRAARRVSPAKDTPSTIGR